MPETTEPQEQPQPGQNQQNQQPYDAEQLAQDLLTRIDKMFQALAEAGVSPFTDPVNLLALQLAGIGVLRIQGVTDLRMAVEHLQGIVQSMNFDPLVAKWGPKG